MPILNQDHRLIRVDSPLGDSKFIATYLTGQEFVSDLFKYDVELFSDDHEIKQQDIVGHPLTLSIHNNGEDDPRIIHGYVNQFSLYDVDASGLRCYRATVVPGFWFLNLGSQNRVFHQKEVKAILEEVFADYKKVVSLKLNLTGSHTPREYCVQFDESDFEFVNRLMAEEGISYYFKHAEGKHELILTDSNQDYFDCCSGKIEYDGGGSQPDKSTVHRWQRDFSYHTGGFEFKDYNEFTTSKDNLKSGKTKNKLNDVTSYQIQRYGAYEFKAEGDNKHSFEDNVNKLVVDRALEFQEMGFDIGSGASDVADFAAGGCFQFDHSLSSEKGKYLLTQVKLTASDGNNRKTSFKNEFTCVPADITPRPDPAGFEKQIHHPQLATVLEVKATESSGAEDLYTQVQVKFPWNSKQNSCWVRVMQSFAGKNWGANFVPRVGQEVVINFVNGDPERPIVTGAVYNGTNTGPKYTSTQSGWKTEYDKSKFNELRFDDKPGEEEVYMEAGKDHNFLIHNDQSGKVENDQTLEVVKNRTITVSEGNESTTVSKGNQTTTVSSGTQTVDVQGAIKITSKTSITLKVGGSTLEMTPSGITLKAIKIDSNASGMSTVKAGGILTLKGSMTMIN
ncbi:type VI secretion system Vgr family protein [Pseudomaricurvus sp.]|uniref:type VI secretion system Vgr family protein n=1 Tax=Pseudomaricurvus sp. TaxID=2004510 RepID=UPI003F6C42AB